MKTLFIAFTILMTTLIMTGCSDADVAKRNLAVAADNFEVQRQIVFYNGITGEYMLVIVGKCAVSSSDVKLDVTCKYADNDLRTHKLGLSDNVTYFVEQIEPIDVGVFHTRIIWKPESIIPSMELKTSHKDPIDK